MEAIGAAASVITIVQTAWYLSVQVKKLIVKIKKQDEDVKHLEDKADTLGAIIKEVENAYGHQEEQGSPLPSESGHDTIRTLVKDATSRCKADLEEFEEELLKLLEKRPTIKGSVLQKWRRETAAPKLARIAKSIESHQFSLQLLIQILHGRSLESTRQVMAKGFFAVLASNRKMFAMLQGLAGPQQGLTRRDTEATLVPRPDDNEAEGQTVFWDENDPALHQFLERIFAVWLKNNLADSGSPVPRNQSTSTGSPFNSPSPTTDPSIRSAGFFGGYAMNHGRQRRPSSPGLDPTETDSASPLRPVRSSSSTQSRTSSYSAASSPNSIRTRSTSVFGSSQTSDRPPLAERNSRSSETRRSNGRSESFADTPVELDLGGSDPQARRKGKELLDCISGNDIQTIERLIGNGASLEERDGTEKTPLLLAAYLGKVDVVRILLRKGANLSARNNTDQTALHLAIKRQPPHAVLPILLNPPKSQQLDSGSESHHLVNAQDKDGRTPLHDCARFGMLASAKTLLAHNADINARDSNGLPPAYFAMKFRKYEIVELLVEKQAQFGDFEWPPLPCMSRGIGNMLKEKGWRRPPLGARS